LLLLAHADNWFTSAVKTEHPEVVPLHTVANYKWQFCSLCI